MLDMVSHLKRTKPSITPPWKPELSPKWFLFTPYEPVSRELTKLLLKFSRAKISDQVRAFVRFFVTCKFLDSGIITPHPTHNLDHHALSAVYPIYSQLPCISGSRSSIRKLRAQHAVVTGTHYHDHYIHILIQFSHLRLDFPRFPSSSGLFTKILYAFLFLPCLSHALLALSYLILLPW